METEFLTTDRAFRAQIALCSVALPFALHGLGKHKEATRLETLTRGLERYGNLELFEQQLFEALLVCYQVGLKEAAEAARVAMSHLVAGQQHLKKGWVSQHNEAMGLATYNAVRGLQLTYELGPKPNLSAATW